MQDIIKIYLYAKRLALYSDLENERNNIYNELNNRAVTCVFSKTEMDSYLWKPMGSFLCLFESGDVTLYVKDNQGAWLPISINAQELVDIGFDYSYEDPDYVSPVTITVEPFGDGYGFGLDDEGYYVNTNIGIDQTYAMCKIIINNTSDDYANLKFDIEQISEQGFDFGLISVLNTDLIADVDDVFTNVARSFQNFSGSTDYTVDVPVGESYLTIKYKKDSSSTTSPDTFRFKQSSSNIITETKHLATIEQVEEKIKQAISVVYKYKGSVADEAGLPTTDNEVGDVYNCEDTGNNFAWTGTAWDKLAGTVDMSNYLSKEEHKEILNKSYKLITAEDITKLAAKHSQGFSTSNIPLPHLYLEYGDGWYTFDFEGGLYHSLNAGVSPINPGATLFIMYQGKVAFLFPNSSVSSIISFYNANTITVNTVYARKSLSTAYLSNLANIVEKIPYLAATNQTNTWTTTQTYNVLPACTLVPTGDSHLVNKKYVDDTVANAGGSSGSPTVYYLDRADYAKDDEEVLTIAQEIYNQITSGNKDVILVFRTKINGYYETNLCYYNESASSETSIQFVGTFSTPEPSTKKEKNGYTQVALYRMIATIYATDGVVTEVSNSHNWADMAKVIAISGTTQQPYIATKPWHPVSKQYADDVSKVVKQVDVLPDREWVTWDNASDLSNKTIKISEGLHNYNMMNYDPDFTDQYKVLLTSDTGYSIAIDTYDRDDEYRYSWVLLNNGSVVQQLAYISEYEYEDYVVVNNTLPSGVGVFSSDVLGTSEMPDALIYLGGFPQDFIYQIGNELHISIGESFVKLATE